MNIVPEVVATVPSVERSRPFVIFVPCSPAGILAGSALLDSHDEFLRGRFFPDSTALLDRVDRLYCRNFSDLQTVSPKR